MNSTSKAERTRNLRYKRPALMSLGYDMMSNELYEIGSACAEVQWFVENDSETLLSALDGDSEAEWEFRMAFSDLSGKVEELDNAIRDSDVREYFDDCTVSLIGNRYKTLGYDTLEEDYFSLTSFEQDIAFSESGKKFMRRTKQEMLSIIGQCLGIVIAFLDVRHTFDYLKATFDILRDENTSILKIVKDIEDAYEAANEARFCAWESEVKRFDRLAENLPERLWLE